eukprot:TRINITY_DN83523_c0_g1_i1.p1 TRINITY_DN83523_c0_g1~~TRINITY_DN83523_c0_g1_i1.p1  ORF type:complete len:165 (-),score=13.34 TRINITY_DN83523_c0_g1_i1:78-518(-)
MASLGVMPGSPGGPVHHRLFQHPDLASKPRTALTERSPSDSQSSSARYAASGSTAGSGGAPSLLSSSVGRALSIGAKDVCPKDGATQSAGFSNLGTPAATPRYASAKMMSARDAEALPTYLRYEIAGRQRLRPHFDYRGRMIMGWR